MRLTCDQIRRFGGHEPAVAVRLLTLLRDVAVRTDPDARQALRDQAERIRDHALSTLSDEQDLAVIRAEAEVALAWIDGTIVVEPVSSARL